MTILIPYPTLARFIIIAPKLHIWKINLKALDSYVHNCVLYIHIGLNIFLKYINSKTLPSSLHLDTTLADLYVKFRFCFFLLCLDFVFLMCYNPRRGDLTQRTFCYDSGHVSITMVSICFMYYMSRVNSPNAFPTFLFICRMCTKTLE